MQSPTQQVTFKAIGAADEATFFDLFSTVRAEELQMDGWDGAARDLVLRSQFDAQRWAYRQEFPSADERLILHGTTAIGWVIVDRSAAAVHGIDIALIASARRRGIGTDIIRELQDEADDGSRPFVITVQRINARARALYERLGFRLLRETDVHCVMEWRRS